MTIGDRVKFKTTGGWYNSGIIKNMYEDSCLVLVDTIGYKPSEDDPITLPYYATVLQDVLMVEHEAISKDENIKLVSYDKCKDCEHYGVWSGKCWNVYECPKETDGDENSREVFHLHYMDSNLNYHIDSLIKVDDSVNAKKEVKINAENESLSEAEREKILSKLSYIKRRCMYDFVNGSSYTRNCISEAANEIERIIKH